MASSSQPVRHAIFKEVKIHTAKCDECNKHNSDVIYRCMECAQQCCLPCWSKRESDGTHLAIGRSIDGEESTIVKAEDIDKVKKRKKQPRSERKKRVPKKTAKAKKDEETVDEADEVDFEEEDTSLLSLSTASNMTTSSKSQPRKSQGDKRKHDSISESEPSNHNHKDYAWAFDHAATEGRKRVKTSKAPVNRHTPPPKQQAGPEESMEYAKYLLELARGPSSGNAGWLGSESRIRSENEQAEADEKMDVDQSTLGSPIQLHRKANQAYVESTGSKSDEMLGTSSEFVQTEESETVKTHPKYLSPKKEDSKSKNPVPQIPNIDPQGSETEDDEEVEGLTPCDIAHAQICTKEDDQIRKEEAEAEKVKGAEPSIQQALTSQRNGFKPVNSITKAVHERVPTYENQNQIPAAPSSHLHQDPMTPIKDLGGRPTALPLTPRVAMHENDDAKTPSKSKAPVKKGMACLKGKGLPE